MAIKYKRQLIQTKFINTLNKILINKQQKEISELNDKVLEDMYKESPAPIPASIKGDRKTEIHFYTTFQNIEEWKIACEFASTIAGLNIADKINIEIPYRWIANGKRVE